MKDTEEVLRAIDACRVLPTRPSGEPFYFRSSRSVALRVFFAKLLRDGENAQEATRMPGRKAGCGVARLGDRNKKRRVSVFVPVCRRSDGDVSACKR